MKIKSPLTTLCLAGLVLLSSASWAAASRYMILLDLSNSNPLVRSKAHAANLARLARRRLHDVKMGDRIILRTFGAYNVSRQMIKELNVNIYLRPENARRAVEQLIAGIPKAIEKGYLKIQGQTNIIGALQRMRGRMQCAALHTNVILVSDGLSNSVYTKGDGLPPEADEPLFDRCGTLTILGLNGNDPRHTRKLEKAWQKWSTGAGFTSFQAIQ